MEAAQKIYELTGVSDERLPDVLRNFRADGAVETETIPESGGLWTVRAKFGVAPVKTKR